jgi:hypothetical protein
VFANEATTFVVFIVLSVAFHHAGYVWVRFSTFIHHGKVPIASHHKAAVVSAAAAVLSQPHVIKGVEAYIEHFVIYSGFVLHH